MGIVMTPAGPINVPGPQMQRAPFEVVEPPTITGDIREGGTVTAQTAEFTEAAFQVSYTFTLLSGGVSVADTLSADGNYVIPAASAGHQLFVRQFAVDEAQQRIYGNPHGVPSQKYTVLAAGAPAFTANPTLSLQRVEGETVTCSPGTITGTPVPSVAYQWWLDGVAVTGQTAATWVIPTGSNGKPFWCEVTATNTAGSASAKTPSATVSSGIVFPATIGTSLWTVTEIRDSTEAAGVSGKRKLVTGAITIPAGFELRWASQASPDPVIKSSLPLVGASGTFVNTFSLPIGTKNGNVLYWRHIASDPTLAENTNAWKEATEIRVITIQGIKTDTAEPPAAGADDWLPMPYYNDAEAAANLPAGDGGQVMLGHHRNELDPNRLYAVQDVGAIRVSIDGGFKWNTLENFGLGSNFGLSVRSDRENPNRVLALMGHRYEHGDNGIYISADGGINWTKAHAYPHALGEGRTGQMRISQAKSTTTRWYCVLDSDDGFKTTLNVAKNPALLTSSQGGAAGTWSKVRDLPAGTYGTHIWGCEPDPSASRKLYVWGSKGLQRFDDAPSATGGVTNFSTGASGMLPLPSGSDGQVRSFNISADGKTLWIAVENHGLYKSTNSGTSWSQFKADIRADYLAVNPGHTDSMWIWEKSGSRVQYSSNGGTGWTTCTIKDELGSNRGISNEPYLIPDPRTANHAHLFGSAYFYNTTNGTAFVRTQDGFLGYHHKNYAGDHMFTDDPLKFAFGMLDVGCMGTTNGAETIFNRPPYAGQKSGNGLAVTGDGLHLLLSVDSETKTQLYHCEGYFTSTPTWTLVRSVSTKGRQWVGYGRGTLDASTAWQLNERATNHGKTSADWSAMANMPANSFVVGVSRATINVTGGTRSVLYAADIDNAGTKRKVYRSTNGGTSWTEVFDAGYNLSGALDFRIVFRVHPTDPYTVFTRSAPSNGISYIRKWNTANGTSETLDIFNGTTPSVSEYRVDAFAVWAANPNYMIARAQGHGGTTRFLRLSTDGGAKWASIGTGIPTVTEGRGLEIHPVTGAIYYGSANGMFTRNLPGATVDSTPNRLKTRYPNRRSVHYSKAYGPDYTTTPDAGTAVLGKFTSAQISQASGRVLEYQDAAPNINLAYAGNTAEVIALTCYRQGDIAIGSSTSDARLLNQLRVWCITGKEPSASAGYAGQKHCRAYTTIAVARHIPRVWDVLTNTEKKKLEQIMRGGAISAAYYRNSNNPHSRSTNLRNLPERVTGNPNLRLWGFGALIAAVTFYQSDPLGGVGKILDILKNYNHSDWLAELNSTWGSASEMRESFNYKAANPSSNVPSATQIREGIQSFKMYNLPLSDLMGILWIETQDMWMHPVAPGVYVDGVLGILYNGQRRARVIDLTPALSNMGVVGMPQEQDSVDHKGLRSSMQYTTWGIFGFYDILTSMIVGGSLDKTHSRYPEILARFKVGTTYAFEVTRQGYYNYAKGGESNSADWSFSWSQADKWGLGTLSAPGYTFGYTDVLLNWMDS